MIEALSGYDWGEAFAYAGDPGDGDWGGSYGNPVIQPALPESGVDLSPFTREDVVDVVTDEGENDGPDWLAMGLLKDGRWFSLRAGCDYTGWD